MGRFFLTTALVAILSTAGLASETKLSEAESEELAERISRFYAWPPDPSAMNRFVPKYNIAGGRFKDGASLSGAVNHDPRNPLKSFAGFKATDDYQRLYCEHVIRLKFPELRCGSDKEPGWAMVEQNDRVERLANTWVPPSALAFSLDDIPVTGESRLPLWSDDYWRTRFGQTSYRYSAGIAFATYDDAARAYSQPAEWGLIKALDPAALAKAVIPWSPAEKYDLSLSDESFSLTRQQKELGRHFRNDKGNVEAWMGLCHGWAGAAVVMPPPKKTVKVKGPRGMDVTWYPADLKAMLTLGWANTKTYNNFIGGRCDVRGTAIHGNGRLIQQECFDTNPATLHLVLGNLIGKQKLSFVMDTTFDFEIWNQPIKSYELTYFDPSDPAKTSKQWKEVAVTYDGAFKARDRFQSPMTRGSRIARGYDDSRIRKIVGVTATIVYIMEHTPPQHIPEVQAENTERVTYTYDLELEERNGKLVPTGGEWHQNTHPDFLWIPRSDTYARTSYDYSDVRFTGTAPVDKETTKIAAEASGDGLTLCRVMKYLVKAATDQDVVRCPEINPR